MKQQHTTNNEQPGQWSTYKGQEQTHKKQQQSDTRNEIITNQ